MLELVEWIAHLADTFGLHWDKVVAGAGVSFTLAMFLGFLVQWLGVPAAKRWPKLDPYVRALLALLPWVVAFLDALRKHRSTAEPWDPREAEQRRQSAKLTEKDPDDADDL